jgi:hypothetical protein
MKSLRWTLALLALLLLLGCSSSTDPDEATSPDIPGLIVFFEFDGNLENAVADRHHATSHDVPVYVEDRHGRAASAIYASTDTIRVADHPELDITGEITLAAWVRPEFSNHAYNAVIDKNYDEAYSLGMSGAVEPDTVAIRGYVTDESFWHSQAIPYGTGTWTHIAFTFVDSTGRGEFYINGAPVGGTTRSITLGTCDKDLRIGVAYYRDRYRGAIDQVAVFNRALSPQEIAALFAFE